jgi:rubrerythrin
MTGKSDLCNLETFRLLEQSFLAEARLAFRYSYFATIAEFEGKQDIAEYFRELAENGEQNVHGSMDFLKLGKDPASGITPGSTSENLKIMIENETDLLQNHYPKMVSVANQEGATDIASWFSTLKHLKRHHMEKLKNFLLEVNNDDE